MSCKKKDNMTRRSFIKGMIGSAGVLGLGALGRRAAYGSKPYEGVTINLLADPAFTAEKEGRERLYNETGMRLNFTSMGDTPEDLISALVVGPGPELYDVVAPGAPIAAWPALVEQDVIQPIDTKRVPNWEKNYDFWKKGQIAETVGTNVDGVTWSLATGGNGDSIGFLPDELSKYGYDGPVDSYAMVFDNRLKGRTGFQDAKSNVFGKTSMYLKYHDMVKPVTIENPADLKPDAIRAVADFVIRELKEGQFKTFWTAFETSVELLATKEVVAMGVWEPAINKLQEKGINAVYMKPKEGWLLWGGGDLLTKAKRSQQKEDAIYEFLNWRRGGWWGAWITLHRNYVTNPLAVEFAKQSPEFTEEETKRIEKVTDYVFQKFSNPNSYWVAILPTHRDVYQEEWERIKTA